MVRYLWCKKQSWYIQSIQSNSQLVYPSLAQQTFFAPKLLTLKISFCHMKQFLLTLKQLNLVSKSHGYYFNIVSTFSTCCCYTPPASLPASRVPSAPSWTCCCCYCYATGHFRSSTTLSWAVSALWFTSWTSSWPPSASPRILWYMHRNIKQTLTS